MPNVFVTSDEHLHHKTVRKMCDRPFVSDDHMAAELVRRHNKVVDAGATTFHLGDFWFGPRTDGRMAEYIAALNGAHVLVLGNHDRASATATNGWSHQREYLDAGFAAVVDVATLTLPKVSAKKIAGGAQPRRVLLSHFPYAADHTDKPRYGQFRLRDEGKWLLHGHVHGLYTVHERGVNCGVDSPMWGYAPANVHDVALLIAQVEAGQLEDF